jgi:hypothetical protein
MTVELDSGIRSFQKLDGENEDLTLILRKKMEIFADTSAFNAGVKEKIFSIQLLEGADAAV